MIENFNDVSDAFDGWTQTITGTRTTGGYVSGRWVDNPTASLCFHGVVQNATPDDLKVLREGDMTEEAIKIHTVSELIAQVGSTTKGDLITYQGQSWMVVNVAGRSIGGYYKVIAVRQ